MKVYYGIKGYGKIKFWLNLIEKQIDKWYKEEGEINEGVIYEEEYQRLKILIWKIAEEIEHK